MAERIGLEAVFEVGSFNQGVNIYVQQLNRITSQTQSASRTLTGVGSSLAAGFGAAAGTAIIDTIRGIGNAISDLGREALNSVRFFEQLQFSIETFTAISLVQEGAFNNVADALGQAQVEAQGYILALQEIAIFSPFTTKQVASFNKLLNVYGFGRQAAFEFTQQLLDFGAAAGLTPEVLNRLAIAMGQVNRQGKILGGEVRQFTNANVGILDIISRSTGETIRSIDELRAKGLDGADTVFAALGQFFEDFEGAGKRVSSTFTGVLSSLEDIREIALSDFFTGVFEPVLPVLQELVDLLSSSDFKANIILLGQLVGEQLGSAITFARDAIASFVETITTLSPETVTAIAAFVGATAALLAFSAAAGTAFLAVNLLLNPIVLVTTAVGAFAAAYVTNFNDVERTTQSSVNVIIDSINSIIDGFSTLINELSDASNDIGEQFNIVASNAAEWGANIVQSLAEGVVASVNIVFEAIATIGEAFAFLMAPGSPPRFLPDLRIWGTAAANEYLDSWTDADFGILNQVGSAIRSQINNLVSLGDFDEANVANLLIGTRQEVANAIQQINDLGNVTVDTLDRIRIAAGPVADEVLGFVERYQRLEQATSGVTQAQQMLNRVQEQYTTLLAPLQRQLSTTQEAQRQAEEQTEILGLQRLIAREGVSQGRKNAAQARIDEITVDRQIRAIESRRDVATDAAQAELEAAKEQQSKAQEELSLFQERINLQNENLGILADERERLEAITNAVNSISSAQKRVAKPVNEQLRAIQLQQQEMQDLIKAAKARAVLEDSTATAAQKTAAQLTLQEVAIRQQIRDVEASKLGISLEPLRDIPIVLEDIGKKGKGAFSGLSSDLSSFEGSLNVKDKLDEFNKSIEDAKNRFDGMKDSIKEVADRLNESLPSFLKFNRQADGSVPIIESLTTGFAGFAAIITAQRLAPALTGVGRALGALGPVGIAAGAAVAGFGAAYSANLFGIQDITDSVVGGIVQKIKDLGTEFDATGTEIGFSFQTLFDNVFSAEGLRSILGDFGFQETFSDFLKIAIEESILLIPELIVGGFTLVGGALSGLINGLAFFADFASLVVESLSSALSFAFEGVAEATRLLLTGLLTGNFDALVEFFSGGDLIQKLQDRLGPLGVALAEVWGNWLPDALVNLGTALSGLLDALFGLVNTIIGGLLVLGASIAAGIVEGIAAWFVGPEAAQTLNETFTNWINSIKKFFGISSPSTLFEDEIGEPIGQGIIEGVVQWLRDNFSAIGDAITFVRDSVFTEENKQSFFDAAGSIGEFIISAFTGKIDEGQGPIDIALKELRDKVFSDENKQLFIDSASQIGIDIVIAMRDGIIDNTREAVLGFLGIRDDMFSGENQQTFTDDAFNLGIDIMGGLSEAFEQAKQTTSNVFNSALDFLFGSAEEEIEAQSPSKKAKRELGIPIVQGLEEGLQEFDPVSAFAALANFAVEALKLFKDDTVAVIVEFVDAATLEFNRLTLNISTDLGTIALSITTTFSDFNTERIPVLRTFANEATLIFSNFELAAVGSVDNIAIAVNDSFVSISTDVDEVLSPATTKAESLFKTMVTNIETIVGGLASKVNAKLKDVITEIEKLEDDFKTAGTSLGDKIVDGILDTLSMRKGEIRDAVAAAVFAGNKQAASTPSSDDTVQGASLLGNNIGGSIADGIANSGGVISSALQTSLNNAIGFINGSIASQPSQGIPGSNVVFNNTYNLNVTSSSPSQGVVKDFDAMRVLG